MEKNIYDVIIIGGGPAGLTASIYSLRSNLKTLLIEEFACGGQTLNTYEIKNYPGFEDITGFDLSEKMETQAKKLGLEQVFEKVINAELSGEIKAVRTQKNEYFGKTIILCMGAKAKKLGVVNEAELTGKGVSYCAVCDGAFFKNKVVAIVGGGNSAMEDVAYLSNLAEKTYLINRTEKFRAMPTLVKNMEAIKETGKIELMLNSEVTQIVGENKLEEIVVKNNKTGAINNLKVDGLFIEIGRSPNVEILEQQVELDNFGYILANEDLQTNVQGVFVAGDIRSKNLRQIITACADGAIAATSAHNYLIKK